MDMRPQVKKRRIDTNDFLEPGNNSLNQEQEVEGKEKEIKTIKDEKPRIKEEKPKLHHGKKKKSAPNKMMPILVTVGIVGSIALVTIVGGKFMKNDSSPSNGNSVQIEDTSIDVNGTFNIPPENSTQQVKPGMNNPSDNTTMNQNSKPEQDVMVKDLNGLSLIQNYTVTEIKTVTDFINYKKHRAITDDGMELLWLEADYKGKSYRVTVPFSIYKELDAEGITVVDMEVLDLGNGSTIISYMKVREDYKKKLDNSLR